jgi:hypothetical protein
MVAASGGASLLRVAFTHGSWLLDQHLKISELIITGAGRRSGRQRSG